MDSRRKLALAVLDGGQSLSHACREAGVTRKTGRKWVNRARESSVWELSERSRAPKSVPGRTSCLIELALVELKSEFSKWGAKKLVAKLYERTQIELPVRTADRILERHGLTNKRENQPEPVRFERDTCGAMLQMDFKGLPASTPYELLTILDDYGRFCLKFGPVADKTTSSVCRTLWELFGEHGLPESMLMDNGEAWGACARSKGPTRFDAWLMRLGVRPIHGRPYHPQTQGKVERFHRTVVTELGDRIIQPSALLAQEVCDAFVRRYNWERPHEALAMKVPGSLYRPWPNKRPPKMPEHEIPEGAVSRKVLNKGVFWFKNKVYHIGGGLTNERIVLKEAEFGMRAYYAGFPLRYLHELDIREVN